MSDKLWIWKGPLRTQKGESYTKRSTAKIPWGWSKFKRTDGRQYICSKQTGRRIQEDRRRSNEATPRKDRNLSKTRIEDPLSEGRYRKKNYSVKDNFEDRRTLKKLKYL